MQETYTNKRPNDFDDEIDLRELFYVLLKEKWIIFNLTAFMSIIGVIYSLSLPNIYESRALLAPNDSSGGISNALSSYSSLASLAGVNLPSSSRNNNSKEAIAKLPSLSFFESHILPDIFLPNLMALKSWNSKTNTLLYDQSIYNEASNSWVTKEEIPTTQESFKVFRLQHMSLSIDTQTGFITLSIKHQSPVIAKEWTELLVNKINYFYRKKDQIESEKAINFLEQKILTTNLAEVKFTIAELLQEETQKLTLIEANESYLFDYIDSPAVMEKKSEPKRSLICIFFALMGGMLSIFTVLFRNYFSKENVI